MSLTDSARVLVCAVVVALLCQCDTTRSIKRDDVGSWNWNRVWKPVSGKRADFIPFDQPVAALPKTPGEWIVDPQDGARFFVPQSGTPKYPAGVLKGEAWKATNRRTLASQRARNSMAVALVPLHVATLGLPRLWIGHGDGGGTSDGGSFDHDMTRSDGPIGHDKDRNRDSDRHDSDDRDRDRRESLHHDGNRRDSHRDDRHDHHRDDRSDDRKSDDHKSDDKNEDKNDDRPHRDR